MENREIELERRRKEFGVVFTYSIIGIFLFYNILFILLNATIEVKSAIPQSVLVFCLIGVVYVAYLVSKTQFNFWAIYKIVTASFFILILYLSMLICHKSTVIFLYYIPVILMILMLTSFKSAAVCAICIILIGSFTSSLSQALNIAHPAKSSAEYLEVLQYLEYVVEIIVVYLSFLILYYYNEFNKIEIKYAVLKSSGSKGDVVLESSLEDNEKGTVDKFDTLYSEIIEYMENEKPYQNPEFNIAMVSKHLQKNSTYISMALNKRGNTKFKTLVNEYRINQVKAAFLEKAYKQFTIEHIFTKAGFSQQSSFNRIFKEQTGVTPSEFIEDIENSEKNI